MEAYETHDSIVLNIVYCVHDMVEFYISHTIVQTPNNKLQIPFE